MTPAYCVYFAGSSLIPARAQQWAAIIRAQPGLHLISSWHDTDPAKWASRDDALDRVEQRRRAMTCHSEIDHAQALWLLWQRGSMRGALAELGYAQALRKEVLVSGVGCSQTIFTSLSRYRDPVDSLAYVELLRLARIERVESEGAVP